MQNIKRTRVQGHVLLAWGGPHHADGSKIDDPELDRCTKKAFGRAACSCGKLSMPIWGNAERKAWHRQHKEEMKHVEVFKKKCTVCGENKIANVTSPKDSDFYIIYRGKSNQRISSLCKSCDNVKSREGNKHRIDVHKRVRVLPSIYKDLARVATKKEIGYGELTDIALKFYLANICPIEDCINLSYGKFACVECLKKHNNFVTKKAN